jgi:hypothetical protein
LTVLTQLRLYPPLRCLVPELQAQVPVELVSALVVHVPALLLEQHVHAPVAVANTRGADFLDASLKAGLIGSTGAIVVGRGVELGDPASPPDRDIPLSSQIVDELALPIRP